VTVLERALAAEIAAERELARIPDWLWDGESLPVPVETVADSHYGLLVREERELASLVGLPNAVQISGLLFPATREIWVDAQEATRAPVRRRFTIGHELGHWVLHCDLGRKGAKTVHCRGETLSEEGAVEEERGRPKLADTSRYPQRELEANQFGAALLMPRARVEAEHAWLDGDVRRLAEAFGVSTMAMGKRLWFLERYLKSGLA
jgi:IrrE N-terminal-like domain